LSPREVVYGNTVVAYHITKSFLLKQIIQHVD
jgi:hypothetical protein